MSTALTVLYDAACPLCSRFRDWLTRQPTLVPLRLVPAGSPQARALFPTLDHDRTLREVTVVADDGAFWTGEHAWVVCLWATRRFRGTAERLAHPAWMPMARGVAASAAGVRHLLQPGPPGRPQPGVVAGGGGYPDGCDVCSPAADQQG